MASGTPDEPRDGAAAWSGLWVGPDYDRGFYGRRLLMVAEIVPADASPLRVGQGLAAELVDGYRLGAVKHRAFTDLARLLLAAPAEREMCSAFFSTVALANVPARPTGTRGAPRNADYQAAPEEIEVLIALLDPEALLVLSPALHLAARNWASVSGRQSLLICLSRHPMSPGFSFRAHVEDTARLRVPP